LNFENEEKCLGVFYFHIYMEKLLEIPKKSPKKYICECCDYTTSYKKDFNKHLTTLKHKSVTMEMNGNFEEIKIRNISPKYYCDCCQYETKYKNDLIKHNNSLKHKKLTVGANKENICEQCNKSFATMSGLWKHKKKCCDNITSNTNIDVIENTSNSNNITSEMFMEFFKQSKDLQNVLVEQNKELQSKLLEMAGQTTIINTNSNNVTNQQFNLNIFLNETCKDAVNIMDFVNSLQLKIEDFEATGRLGYVEGISRIIVNSMKDMDIEKRPMHCTDLKRETLYIKDQNVWTKENPDKNKFKRAVKQVAKLNLNQLPKWQEKNPDCVNINTPENEEFIKLSLAALGSRTPEEEDKFVDKIMKNVLKEVIIDKK